MWISLDSPDAIEKLADDFSGFHDSCLREISVSTETFVAPDLSMACPPHLDTSVLVFLQSQSARVRAIEIRCQQVAKLSVTATADGCDSIIAAGAIGVNAGWYRLALNFLGAPLVGPPNTSVWSPTRDFSDPDVDIIAKLLAWRPITEGLGSSLRYRPPGLLP